MRRLRKVAFWTVFVMIWLDLAATMFLIGAGKLLACLVAAVLVIVLMATAIFLDPSGPRRDSSPHSDDGLVNQPGSTPGRATGTRAGRLNRVLTDHDHAESDRLWAEFEQPWEQAEWDG